MTRVAITGGTGQLGRQLVRAFTDGGHEVLVGTRDILDITDHLHLEALVDWAPEIVVNAAAWTDVDGCARDPERAMHINAEAAGRVAEAAARVQAVSVQVSTNEVFDGASGEPYGVDAEPCPINPYGASKLGGERATAAANPLHRIVRTAWLFGPGGKNFVTKILDAARRAAASGRPLPVVYDEIGNPTWTPDLAAAIVRIALASNGEPIVHAVGTPPASRLEWATLALEAAGVRVPLEQVSLADFVRASTVPPRAVLVPSTDLESDWRPITSRYASEVVASA